ncbi:MAG: tRNA (adenosine(37)-N6)-threonylcarbamoyltransferase complex ATPase subunit type 1 TsaE [Chloroflexota bacterium]|nr:tRNA (adenosine(37)-N6)-threonylcarbamoyltransferase complex ATPase subunit type 1 TsaE [Chloroflexota bacterium]
MRWTLRTSNSDETLLFGRKLGETLVGDELFLLVGSLGAGKTTMTQGIANGLGVNEYTKSPTFVLVNEYEGRVPLVHADLYRVAQTEEAWLLGLDDYMFTGAVMVVEWGDRAQDIFPDDHIVITIEVVSDDVRDIIIESKGSESEITLGMIRKNWEFSRQE